jgi:hypothetical protein
MVKETKIGPHVKNGNLHGKRKLYWLVNIIVLCIGHRGVFFFQFCDIKKNSKFEGKLAKLHKEKNPQFCC